MSAGDWFELVALRAPTSTINYLNVENVDITKVRITRPVTTHSIHDHSPAVRDVQSRKGQGDIRGHAK